MTGAPQTPDNGLSSPAPSSTQGVPVSGAILDHDEIPAIGDWPTNGHLIADCARLGYLRDDDTILDPTYGYGTFWTIWQPLRFGRLIRSDLNPAKSPDAILGVNFTALPWANRHFHAVVFDPPYKLNGTPSDTDGIDERYGVHGDSYFRWQDRMRLIRDGAAECARVCQRSLLVKCQDQVVSGKIRWQTKTVAAVVEPMGFGLRARFDFLGGRAQPAGRTQKNPRSCSSQLLVFERGWEWEQ